MLNKEENKNKIYFHFKGSELTFFDRDMLPDDPTARPKIELGRYDV